MLAVARKQKEEYMSEVYRILSIALGVPPKPKEKFTFEYYDTDGKYHSYTGTPIDFYKDYRSQTFSVSARSLVQDPRCGLLRVAVVQLPDSFSLVNDPRNPYEALYTVDKLGNVWGGRPVTCKLVS